MSDKKMLERFSNELPTLEEFDKKYCQHCGTQRCCGVFDELWREGCRLWQEYKKFGNESKDS